MTNFNRWPVMVAGMEQNPSSLLARVHHDCLLAEGHPKADSLLATIEHNWGNPRADRDTAEAFYVSPETTFDEVCDVLVAAGARLLDSLPADQYGPTQVATFLESAQGDLYRVQFLSTAALASSATVLLDRAHVTEFVADLCRSGCWEVGYIQEVIK